MKDDLRALSRRVIGAKWRLVEEGLADETTGNISVRCPDGISLLITPSARDYRLLTERDLVRLHLGSGMAEGRLRPSSEWHLHLTIYRVRPDVDAVIHHHGTWASAVAVARRIIPVLIDEAADIGPIATAPYARSTSEELAAAAAGELTKGSNAVLLANHGAVAVGRNLWEALRRALEVERLAKIYIGAELLGGAHPLDEARVTRSQEFFEAYRAASAETRELFPAAPDLGGRVGFRDLVTYSLRSAATFASLVSALLLQRLHR